MPLCFGEFAEREDPVKGYVAPLADEANKGDGNGEISEREPVRCFFGVAVPMSSRSAFTTLSFELDGNKSQCLGRQAS